MRPAALCTFLALAACTAPSAPPAPTAGTPPSTAPAVAVSQTMPSQEGITEPGSVTVRFDIDPHGAVTNPAILSSTPPGLYDSRALEAVSQWRYRPKVEASRTVPDIGHTVKLNFDPSQPDSTGAHLVLDGPLYYPRNAFVSSEEGAVTVKFSINELGRVDKTVVVASTPPKIFDAFAQDHIRGRFYVPPVKDGIPVRSPPVTETITYRLSEAVLAPRLVTRPNIAYPMNALQMGLEGDCDLQLALAKDGTVLSATVLQNDAFNVFNRACQADAKTLKYEPATDTQNPPISRSPRLHLSFKIGGAQHARPLLAPGQWIKLGYDLNASGQVENATILAHTASDKSAHTALDSLRAQSFPRETDPARSAARKGKTLVIIAPSIPPDF